MNSLTPTTPIDKNPNLTKKIKSFSGKPVSFNKNQLKIADDLNSVPIVRNDIPDVFWQSVEPYCADITEEDIKMLENQIEIQDNYMSSFKSDLTYSY